MKCDLCPEPIVVGRQDFVIDEAPCPGSLGEQTLVTYSAHRACHDREQAAAAARREADLPNANDPSSVYWAKVFGWGR